MPGSSEQDAERTVRLPEGVALHARPAGLLVREAARFDARVTVHAGDRQADAASILAVMALGAGGGSEVTLRATGPQAAEAVDALGDLLVGIS